MATSFSFVSGLLTPSVAQARPWSFQEPITAGNPFSLGHPTQSSPPFSFRSTSAGRSIVSGAPNASGSATANPFMFHAPPLFGVHAPPSTSVGHPAPQASSLSTRTVPHGLVPGTRRQVVPVANKEELSFQVMLDAFNSLRISPEPYNCGVCLETKTDDADLALVVGCKHKFCRECLREYVGQQVSDRKYPVLCPLCMVSSAKDRISSELNSVHVAQLGLSAEQYDAFVDLELTPHAEKVCCPRCGIGAFVEKGGLNGKLYMKCFFNGCDTMWCRGCNKIVADAERKAHFTSCDNGSQAVAALAQKSGWKKCPGCSAMIERISGCNHITCRIPTCNTHFCYKCGKTIIQSKNKGDIRAAVNSHYRTCSLFDVPRLPVLPRARQLGINVEVLFQLCAPGRDR